MPVDPDCAADAILTTALPTPAGRLNVNFSRLTSLKVLFRQTPKTGGGRYFGSRLVTGRDGTLFITIAKRGERDRAQAHKPDEYLSLDQLAAGQAFMARLADRVCVK